MASQKLEESGKLRYIGLFNALDNAELYLRAASNMIYGGNSKFIIDNYYETLYSMINEVTKIRESIDRLGCEANKDLA